MLLAAPLASLVSRNPVPPVVLGTSAISILGSGMLVQLASLPSELDASFRKPLPLLREGYIDSEQEKAAKKILLASCLTYFASSLVGALSIWRWMPSPTGTGTPHPVPTPAPAPPAPGKAPRVSLAPICLWIP